jgi:hypothetical protein
LKYFEKTGIEHFYGVIGISQVAHAHPHHFAIVLLVELFLGAAVVCQAALKQGLEFRIRRTQLQDLLLFV